MVYGWLSVHKRITMTVVAVSTLLTSLLVIFGWISDTSQLLSIVPYGPTMKFNTAALFALSAFGLYLHSIPFIKRDSIVWPIAVIIITISLITLAEYLFDYQNIIDSLVIKDAYSDKYPGRMSAATALSFLLLGISLLGVKSRSSKIRVSVQYMLTIVFGLSLLSVIAYVLEIPINNRVPFIDTMALHTSILFGLLSLSLSLINPEMGFFGLFLGNNAGSRAIRLIIPFIVILPVGLSYLVLVLNNKGALNLDFGVALYTLLLIFIGIFAASVYSANLNINDIERKELEKSLRQTNRELFDYKKAIERTALVVITDSQGVIQHVNPNFCELTGYKKKELMGETFSMFNTSHYSPNFLKRIYDSINHGKTWTGKFRSQSKNGRNFWVYASIVPFDDDDGEIYQYLFKGNDITTSKNAELATKEYVKELKQKNKELSEFVYIASHDLQEPLRTVANYSSLFTKKYGEQIGEQGISILDFIAEATSRMQNQIKGILDYSRIGKNITHGPVDSHKVVENALKDMAATIEQTHAKISFSQLPKVLGNAAELGMLFQNLIANSIKFKREGIKPVVQISATKENKYWKFSVTDNGIGINPDYGHKIFHIFQRLHKRTEYSGTGIGLAHCKKIVELHHGELWFESVLGQGTTFYFTLKATK